MLNCVKNLRLLHNRSPVAWCTQATYLGTLYFTDWAPDFCGLHRIKVATLVWVLSDSSFTNTELRGCSLTLARAKWKRNPQELTQLVDCILARVDSFEPFELFNSNDIYFYLRWHAVLGLARRAHQLSALLSNFRRSREV